MIMTIFYMYRLIDKILNRGRNEIFKIQSEISIFILVLTTLQ